MIIGTENKNISAVEIDPFLTFRLYRTTPSCLDHQSTIQSKLNMILSGSKPIGQVNHRKKKGRDRLAVREVDLSNLDLIKKSYRDWKKNYENYPRYIHIHVAGEDGKPEPGSIRLWTRFHNTRNVYHLSRALEGYSGPAVFLTLTVNRYYPLEYAWKRIMRWWNQFVSNLARELGIPRHEFRYVWVLEAQADGYPHLHILFLGWEWLYRAGNKEEYENDNPHSKNLKHLWGRGSIFINKTWKGKTIRKPINYLMKYIRKQVGYEGNGKTELTHALLWFYGRRQWGKSRHLLGWLGYEKPKKAGTVSAISVDTYERLRGQRTPLERPVVEDHDDPPVPHIPTVRVITVMDMLRTHRWLYRKKKYRD